jgi:hypothetical protein
MVCVVLKVSQTFFSKSILDNRELGLMIDEISLLGGGSPFLRQAGTIKNNEIIVGGQETGLGEGFYPQEDDGLCKFRWTKTAAVFNLSSLPKTAECLEILASAPDNSLRIFEVFANEQKIGQGILKSGWKIYQCFFRPAAAQLRLMIKVNRSLPETFKNAGDERELGMMISRISLVDI